MMLEIQVLVGDRNKIVAGLIVLFTLQMKITIISV